MPQSYAEIRDAIENILQDGASNTIFKTPDIDLRIDDALSEIARYAPYVATWILAIEGRTGSASSTTSDALVDAGKSQFVSGDVDKMIFNTTDKTWAKVTAFVSSSQLTLSKDIMASGESYEMYNENCWENNQVNIEGLKDWIEIPYAVYPSRGSAKRRRNVEVRDFRRVLELDIGFTPNDTSLTNADKEVYVVTHERHRLPAVTDWAGAVNNGNLTVGSTTISVDGFGTSETLAEGELITFAGTRGIYRITADKTMSSGGGDIVIYPGLMDVIVDGDVVSLIKSTLTPELEKLLVELVVGELAVSQAINFIDEANKGGANTWSAMTSWGERSLAKAQQRLRRMSPPRTNTQYPRS